MSTHNITPNIEEIEKILEKQIGQKVRVVTETDTINATLNMVTKSCRCSPSSIITPSEVFKMADKLNMRSEEIIMRYCSVTVSKNTGVPVVALKSDGVCPFVDGNECSLGTAKPIPCGLFPVSRVITMAVESTARKEIFFLPKKANTIGKSYTVKEWLDANDIPNKDKESEKFHQFIKGLILKFDFRKLEKDEIIPDELKAATLATTITRLYGKYEPNTDMDIEGRFSRVETAIETLLTTFPHLKR